MLQGQDSRVSEIVGTLQLFWRPVTLEKLLKLADLEDFLNLVIQVNQMILVIFM